MFSDESREARFAAYIEALIRVMGHADRATPLRDYCTGLLMQQFSFWWTGVRPKGHTGLEKDWAAILGRLGLIQGRDGGARQPAERRAALL